jgi:hypothetical protein
VGIPPFDPARRDIEAARPPIDPARRDIGGEQPPIAPGRRSSTVKLLSIGSTHRSIDPAHHSIDSGGRGIDLSRVPIDSARRRPERAHRVPERVRLPVSEGDRAEDYRAAGSCSQRRRHIPRSRSSSRGVSPALPRLTVRATCRSWSWLQAHMIASQWLWASRENCGSAGGSVAGGEDFEGRLRSRGTVAGLPGDCQGFRSTAERRLPPAGDVA